MYTRITTLELNKKINKNTRLISFLIIVNQLSIDIYIRLDFPYVHLVQLVLKITHIAIYCFFFVYSVVAVHNQFFYKFFYILCISRRDPTVEKQDYIIK